MIVSSVQWSLFLFPFFFGHQIAKSRNRTWRWIGNSLSISAVVAMISLYEDREMGKEVARKNWATQFVLGRKAHGHKIRDKIHATTFFHPRFSDANFKTVVLDWRIRHAKSGKRALATFRKECDGMRSTTANRYSSKIFHDFSRDIRKTWTWRWHVDLAFEIQCRPFHLSSISLVAHPSVKKYIEPTRSCILIRLNALSSRRKFFPCWQKCHISPCFNH